MLGNFYLIIIVKLILIYFSSIVKQPICDYVNTARILSRNQPVQSNGGKVLLNETKAAVDGAQTHNWQESTEYESDALPTAPRRLMFVC